MAVITDPNAIPRVPGTDVGVVGGIPTTRTNIIDVTQSPYNADKTGATDAKAAIQGGMERRFGRNDIICIARQEPTSLLSALTVPGL